MAFKVNQFSDRVPLIGPGKISHFEAGTLIGFLMNRYAQGNRKSFIIN